VLFFVIHKICILSKKGNPEEDFRKITKYQISRNSVQWEPSYPYGRMDRRADTKKLTVGFRNFASEPEKINVSRVISVLLSSLFYLYYNLS